MGSGGWKQNPGLGKWSNSIESALQKEKVVHTLLAKPAVISVLWNSCCTWGMCLSVSATVDRNIPFGPYSGNRYNLVLLTLLFVCICHGN